MPNRLVSSARQTFRNIADFVNQRETSTPNETVLTTFQRTERVSLCYVAYRWAQFILHLLIYLGSFLDLGGSTTPMQVPRGWKFYAKWFLYMTHWGVFLNLIQSLMGAILLSLSFKNRNRQTPNSVFGTPLSVASFYRYAFGIALNMSVWITFGFWALIYNPVEYPTLNVYTVSQHGIGSILLLLDLVVVKFPYKLMTGVYTVLLGILYEHVLIGHYLVGGLDRYEDRPYLYEVQNWEKPLVASAVVGSGCVIIISFNFLLWGLYQLKRHFVAVVRSHPSSNH